MDDNIERVLRGTGRWREREGEREREQTQYNAVLRSNKA
jgi:hypothetical protein